MLWKLLDTLTLYIFSGRIIDTFLELGSSLAFFVYVIYSCSLQKKDDSGVIPEGETFYYFSNFLLSAIKHCVWSVDLIIFLFLCFLCFVHTESWRRTGHERVGGVE